MSTEAEHMVEDLHEFPKEQLEQLISLSKNLERLSPELTKVLENAELEENFKTCWENLMDEKGEFNIDMGHAIQPSDILVITDPSPLDPVKHRANKFLTSLKNTLEDYYDLKRTKANDIKTFQEKLRTIYKKFKAEFGNTEDGRSKITRIIRWFGIKWDYFAIAHLLLAEMGAELGENDCYEEYTKAFKDTNNNIIEALSLWGKIKLLSSSTVPKEIVVNNAPISDTEKEALFHDTVNNFKKRFPNLIQNYLKQIYESGYISFSKVLDASELYMIDHNDPHGAFLKIFRDFSKAIYPLLHKTNFFDSDTLETVSLEFESETFSSIKANLSNCWKFIMDSYIIDKTRNLSLHELKILNQIMSFINNFFDNLPAKDPIFDEHPTLLKELGLATLTGTITEKQFIASTVLSDRAVFDVFCEANGDDSCQNLSLEGILSTLIDSEEFAKMTLKTNKNWLHFLSRVSDPLSRNKDRINKYKMVFKKLKEYGVSFYHRTWTGITPFMCISWQGSNEIERLMRPATRSGVHFIGIDETMNKISDFLIDVKNKQTEERAICLVGPPGVGKADLIRYLVRKYGYSCEEFEQAREDCDNYANQYQARLINFFKNARSRAARGTCVCIFMDELDTIAADYKGKPLTGHLNQKAIVTTIQTEIDRLKGTQVVFIGTTSTEESIKSAIRDKMRSIHFKLPDEPTRKKIIEDQLRNYYVEQEVIDQLSEATCSWSLRSIVNFIKASIKKRECLTHLKIEDFMLEFEEITKSKAAYYSEKCKKLHIEFPKLEETNNKSGVIYKYINTELEEAFNFIRCYLMDPKAYRKRKPGIKCNTLLTGKPGIGKSSFAALVANKVKCIVIKVNSGTIQEAAEIEKIFSIANSFEKAIIMFDEMDAIASKYSPYHTVLQSDMDGLIERNSCIAIIGTTNKKDQFSEAVLSRFGRPIEISLPNKLQLKELFFQYLPEEIGLNVDLKERLDEVCEAFATQAADIFAPRDVSLMVDEAVIMAETRHQMYMYESKSKTPSTDPKRRPSIKEEDLEKCFQRKLATHNVAS